MNRIRVSPHFYLDEFINFYTYFSEADNGLRFIKQKTIDIAEFVRDYFGKGVTINNWWGWYLQTGGHDYPNKPAGIYDMRGYRPKDDPYQMIYGAKVPGAKFSMHRSGDAIDFNVSGLTTKEVYEAIQVEQKFFDAGIRRMENIAFTAGWTHIDQKIVEGKTKIHIFNP